MNPDQIPELRAVSGAVVLPSAGQAVHLREVGK